MIDRIFRLTLESAIAVLCASAILAAFIAGVAYCVHLIFDAPYSRLRTVIGCTILFLLVVAAETALRIRGSWGSTHNVLVLWGFACEAIGTLALLTACVCSAIDAFDSRSYWRGFARLMGAATTVVIGILLGVLILSLWR